MLHIFTIPILFWLKFVIGWDTLWLFSANLSNTRSRVLPEMPSGGCDIQNNYRESKIISLLKLQCHSILRLLVALDRVRESVLMTSAGAYLAAHAHKAKQLCYVSHACTLVCFENNLPQVTRVCSLYLFEEFLIKCCLLSTEAVS